MKILSVTKVGHVVSFELETEHGDRITVEYADYQVWEAGGLWQIRPNEKPQRIHRVSKAVLEQGPQLAD